MSKRHFRLITTFKWKKTNLFRTRICAFRDDLPLYTPYGKTRARNPSTDIIYQYIGRSASSSRLKAFHEKVRVTICKRRWSVMDLRFSSSCQVAVRVDVPGIAYSLTSTCSLQVEVDFSELSRLDLYRTCGLERHFLLHVLGCVQSDTQQLLSRVAVESKKKWARRGIFNCCRRFCTENAKAFDASSVGQS